MINQEELKKTSYALKKKLAYLKNVLVEQESQPIVRQMLDFEACPEDEQWRIMAEWNDYYDKVKTTKAYQRFCLIKEAFVKRDFGRAKEIIEVDKRAWEEGKSPELAKPRSFDYETNHNSLEFINYLSTKKSIKAIEEELKLREEGGGLDL